MGQKRGEKIWEILSGILLFAVLIFKTVFHKQDSDIVFDAGGKIVIVMLLFLFFVIYYIQIKKTGKGS